MENVERVSKDPIARAAEGQRLVGQDVQVALQRGIQDAFKVFGDKAEEVQSALHGDWLHEPLHAAITDVPVGAWTATVLFDFIGAASGSHALDPAADACNLLGLAGAVGAAVTGMNDWSGIEERAPRNIGVVHALLNIGATGLFGASALARRRSGSRDTARWMAAAGIALVAWSAHLGGSLVYEHGVGVERPADSESKA